MASSTWRSPARDRAPRRQRSWRGRPLLCRRSPCRPGLRCALCWCRPDS